MRTHSIPILILSVVITASPVSAGNMNESAMNGDTNITTSSVPTGGMNTKAPDNNSVLTGNSLDSLIGSMAESSLTGKEVSLSGAMAQNFGFAFEQSPYFSTGSFHEAGLELDTGAMNVQFDALSAGILGTYGDSISALGQSSNALTLFQSEYGDIAEGLTLEKFEMPESFDPGKMINEMHTAMTSEYADATSTGAFASVKSSLDIGDIFSRANQGVSSDIVGGLMSSSSMQSMLSGLSGGAKGTIAGEYSAAKAANAGPDMESFYSSAMQDTMGAFDLSGSILGSSAAFDNKFNGTKNIAERIAGFDEYKNRKNWNDIKDAKAAEIAKAVEANKAAVKKESDEASLNFDNNTSVAKNYEPASPYIRDDTY